jgi:putative PIN family toxin of toxin-antitoxin system
LRIVLDTNVVVSAILFEHGELAWIREAWTTGGITPLIDRPCLDELVRVLTYPKFRLTEGELRSLLGSYLPHAVTVDTSAVPPGDLPRCRDPEDDRFLLLASEGEAEALVTGDAALLFFNDTATTEIYTPAELRERMRSRS